MEKNRFFLVDFFALMDNIIVNMQTDIQEPKTLDGNLSIDDRGNVRFVNGFDFAGVKRFYQVENHDTTVIRAFHGHMKEAKYAYVVSGAVLICVVPIDNKKHPSKNAKVERFILSSQKPSVLYIPLAHANGFKSLTDDTKIIFFSTSTVDESKGDDYRFPHNYWGENIWTVENR